MNMERFEHADGSFEEKVFSQEKINFCIEQIQELLKKGWDGTPQKIEGGSDILVVKKNEDFSLLKRDYLVFFEIKVGEDFFVVYDSPRT